MKISLRSPDWAKVSYLAGGLLGLGGVLPIRAELPGLRALTRMFQPLHLEQASISPDGTKVAFGVNEKQEAGVELFDLETGRMLGLAEAGEHLEALGWVGQRVVFGYDRGTQGIAREIHSVDANGGNDLKLVDSLDAASIVAQPRKNGTPLTFPRQPEILSLPIGPQAGVIVAAVGRSHLHPDKDEGAALVVYRIDVTTAKRVTIFDDLVPSHVFLCDETGMPRIALAKGKSDEYSFLSGPGSRWVPLRERLKTEQVDFAINAKNFLGARAVPMAYDETTKLFYYASNEQRDTYGVYAFDLERGNRTVLLEDPEFDAFDGTNAYLRFHWSAPELVWDRFTRQLEGVRYYRREQVTKWLDPEIAAVQTALNARFHQRMATVIDWDMKREHFLVRVAADGEAGSYYVFEPTGAKLKLLDRRQSTENENEVNRTQRLSLDGPNGESLTGLLTLPQHAMAAHPPLIVYLHDVPYRRNLPEYDPGPQALAEMGFAVLQLDHAGSPGSGRQRMDDLIKTEAGPVDEIQAAVAGVIRQGQVDPKKIALLGEGFGGYLALRALQLNPQIFLCAAAIDPISDFTHDISPPPSETEKLQEKASRQAMQDTMKEMGGKSGRSSKKSEMKSNQTDDSVRNDGVVVLTEAQLRTLARNDLLSRSSTPLERLSITTQAERLIRPVMLLHDPQNETVLVEQSKQLAQRLARLGRPPLYWEMKPHRSTELSPGDRAAIFLQLEKFFASNLYQFDVKIKDLEVKESDVK
jgi:dipeptidyl aminopeptidase/acylaminoacyl peptidase